MDSLIPLLLLSACSSAFSEPLSSAIKRRSDLGVYASNFAREYMPVIYVAVPLHSPIPILHILSNKPLEQRPKYRGNQAQRLKKPYPLKLQKPYEEQSFAANKIYPMVYAPYAPNVPYPAKIYAPSTKHEWYAKPNAQESAAVILYAKPNKNGGYTYRKTPSKKTPPTMEPFIIRVHKYRIVKDR